MSISTSFKKIQKLQFFSLLAATPNSDVFGKISPPPGVDKFNAAAGPSGIGLVIFFSNLIRLSAVVAGLWTMLNFILAGWIYITSSGDSGAHKKVMEKINMSVMGLALIVCAYTIAALLGLIFFGKADYIINPTIIGVN